ncbi:hypothetical protein FJ364_04365 [Candidatus Dependentiae bacterium]|nr:hypothetical protein [Candidatus Dependentiae bacterium]
MKRIVVFLCSVAIALTTSASTTLPGYLSHGVADIKKSINATQDSFEEMYFQTLIQNESFFDDAYNNNLVISTAIDWDFANNGVIFMKLIDFLEKKGCSESLSMLSKLNELFYLLFHRHLSLLDVSKEKQVELINCLYYLYHFKDTNDKEVLRSVLTRVFIYTLMVEVLGLSYSDKKEILLLAYEDFRAGLNELIASNTHNKEEAFTKVNIFINDLSAYGTREPIVRPHRVKRWIITIMIVGAIAGGIYYIGKKIGTWDHLKQMINEAVAGITKTFSDTLYENFSKPTAKAMMDELEARSRALGEGLGAGATDGMAHEFEDAPVDDRKRKPNRNTAKLGEMLGDNVAKGANKNMEELARGMVRGFVEEPTNAPDNDRPVRTRPNRNTQRLAGMLGENLGEGMVDTIEASNMGYSIMGGRVTMDERAQRLQRRRQATADRERAIQDHDAAIRAARAANDVEIDEHDNDGNSVDNDDEEKDFIRAHETEEEQHNIVAQEEYTNPVLHPVGQGISSIGHALGLW